ncbi:MAG: glycosyltransferase family 4 protein [Candidatus Latescibacteria bacterium]|nr:glycosyltransferase family 4 protein [Candidatus Latescibacterota bacterium]
MKKVLFITYYFPPMGLGGVQRTLKFVKYLPSFGWQPIILTVRPGSYFAFDPSLLKDIPAAAEVVRTGSLDPLKMLSWLQHREKTVEPPENLRRTLSYLSQMVFQPDNKLGWLPFALSKAREILHQESVEIIYATAPPFTCHLIGILLSRLYRKPLVVDFRDAWTQFQFVHYPTSIHRLLNQLLEKKVIRKAARVISTNEVLRENLRKAHPRAAASKFTVIPHGFDPDDFKNKGKPSSTGKFTVTYSGSFYATVTPKHFLSAVREILDEEPGLANEIKLLFLGMFREENKRLVNKLNLQDVVDIRGYLPHSESVVQLLNSDLLWLTLDESEGAEAVTPSKLFEYIASGRPILACVPEGAAAQIVRSTGNGIVVPPDDIQGIKKAILGYYNRYRAGKLKRTTPKIIQKYDRQRLTGELVRVFDKTVLTVS